MTEMHTALSEAFDSYLSMLEAGGSRARRKEWEYAVQPETLPGSDMFVNVRVQPLLPEINQCVMTKRGHRTFGSQADNGYDDGCTQADGPIAGTGQSDLDEDGESSIKSEAS
jgi:hypothetical protein